MSDHELPPDLVGMPRSQLEFRIIELQVALGEAQRKLGLAMEALDEIAEHKGRFSMDRLKHATNTVEDMTELAVNALKELKTREAAT